MKRTLKLGTVIVLFWNSFVFAQSPSSTDKKPEQATVRIGPYIITTDTQGADFGPYMQRVVHDVKQNWYNLIPVSAKPPLLKKGKLAIEFGIKKNGKITHLRYRTTSGDVALDRAAFIGIKASNPFPPLPAKFHGPYFGLIFTFFYNPWLNGIAPSGAQVRAGSSLQFSPVLTGNAGSTNSVITWSVVGRDCAFGWACGRISEAGLYTAPLTVPDDPTIKVEATVNADGGEGVSAVVTILPHEPSQNNGQH